MHQPESIVEIRVPAVSVDQLREFLNTQLRHRRWFTGGASTFRMGERYVIIFEYSELSTFSIEAEVVFLKCDEPNAGVGFELLNFDSSRLSAFEEFIAKNSEIEVPLIGNENKGTQSIYDRIRHLNLRERETIARQGNLTERVALERCFGSSIWEGLLQNPQLTAPEVAHIAKNGTIPIPLVAAITGHKSWLSSGEVRRALLSNPRTTGIQLERVLTAMSRTELRQILQASPYRAQVKTLAKKLLGED